MVGAIGELGRNAEPQLLRERGHVAGGSAQIHPLAVDGRKQVACLGSVHVKRLDRKRRFGQASREVAGSELPLLFVGRRAEQRADLALRQEILQRRVVAATIVRGALVKPETSTVLKDETCAIEKLGPRLARGQILPFRLIDGSKALRENREHRCVVQHRLFAPFRIDRLTYLPCISGKPTLTQRRAWSCERRPCRCTSARYLPNR